MNHLTLPLAVAFLFVVGAVLGWCLEFCYRNLISHNGPRGKYFINPGFCKGPWLPIYGIGVSAMCVISYFVTNRMDPAFVNSVLGTIATIIVLGLVMIAIEFIGGYVLLKVFNMRLWDYRQEPGNIMGIICPKFSIIWTAIGAIYYLFIHEIALDKLVWFSENLAFSFFVGLILGFFIIDYCVSLGEATLIKKYADDHDVVVKYEELKALIQQRRIEEEKKQLFFKQTASYDNSLYDNLDEHSDALEEKKA